MPYWHILATIALVIQQAAAATAAVGDGDDACTSLPKVEILSPVPGSVFFSQPVVNLRIRVTTTAAHHHTTKLPISVLIRGSVVHHVDDLFLGSSNLNDTSTVIPLTSSMLGGYGPHSVLVRVDGVPAFARVTFFYEEIPAESKWLAPRHTPFHNLALESFLSSLLPRYDPLLDFGCQHNYFLSTYERGYSRMRRMTLTGDCNITGAQLPPFWPGWREGEVSTPLDDLASVNVGSTLSICLQASCTQDLDPAGIDLRLRRIFDVTARRCVIVWPENQQNEYLSKNNLMEHARVLGMHYHHTATAYAQEHFPFDHLGSAVYVFDVGPPTVPDIVGYTGAEVIITSPSDDETVSAVRITSPLRVEASVLNLLDTHADVQLYFNNTLVTEQHVVGPVEDFDLVFDNLHVTPGRLYVRAELVLGGSGRRVPFSYVVDVVVNDVGAKNIDDGVDKKSDNGTTASAEVDENREFRQRPPKEIPPHLVDDFTMGGVAHVLHQYNDDTAHYPLFSAQYILDTIWMIRHRLLTHTNYRFTDQYFLEALDMHWKYVANRTVLLVGSAGPWYECMAVAHGATTVTVEYHKLHFDHPQMTTYTLDEFAALNPKPRFDAAISISSLEHDGLGRYGDPIDPIGDLKSMDRLRQLINPGGVVFFAVPTGKDTVVYNVHRVYGRARLPLMLRGWKMIASYGLTSALLDGEPGLFDQSLLVLTPDDSDESRHHSARVDVTQLARSSADVCSLGHNEDAAVVE